MIELVLPYPVSANRYWTQFRLGNRMMQAPSKEAKAFKEAVAFRARRAGITEPLPGRIALTIALFPKLPQDWKRRVKSDPVSWDDTVMCLDLDNALKVLIDAIKGIVIEDDKWVRSITATRQIPDGEGRVVLGVERIAVLDAAPNLELFKPSPEEPKGEAWVDPFEVSS